MSEEKNEYPAFVTGSRRYGTPTKTSDIDLVVLTDDNDDELIDLLSNAADEGSAPDENEVGQNEGRWASLRFGDLNLILVDKGLYRAWKDATDELVAMKPVTRDQAIEVHRKHRAKV